MASDIIIKFYSGTAEDLAVLTDNKATCIGLQTDTGKLFWKMYGNKFYLKIGWDQIVNRPQDLSDSGTIAALVQQTLNNLLPSYDFTQLQRGDVTIDSTRVIITGQGSQRRFTYATGKEARPCWILGQNMYSVQPQSVTINQDATLSLQLSRYLAYQNINSATLTAFPSGWKLSYR